MTTKVFHIITTRNGRQGISSCQISNGTDLVIRGTFSFQDMKKLLEWIETPENHKIGPDLPIHTTSEKW